MMEKLQLQFIQFMRLLSRYVALSRYFDAFERFLK